MSGAEETSRAARAGDAAAVTVEDVRALMGASTPHFALQLRDLFTAYRSLLEQGRGRRTYAYVLLNAVFHSGVVLIVAAFTHVPRALNVVLIALDIALFAVLFKFLRARFLDARRERVFAGGR